MHACTFEFFRRILMCQVARYICICCQHLERCIKDATLAGILQSMCCCFWLTEIEIFRTCLGCLHVLCMPSTHVLNACVGPKNNQDITFYWRTNISRCARLASKHTHSSASVILFMLLRAKITPFPGHHTISVSCLVGFKFSVSFCDNYTSHTLNTCMFGRMQFDVSLLLSLLIMFD